MQTDILYKQLIGKLSDLKVAIERFEKHNPPSTSYAEELHKALNEANKLTSAYAILKEQKDLSPDLNLHLKLMNVEKASTELKDVASIAIEHKPEIAEIKSEPVVVAIPTLVEQKIQKEESILEVKKVEPVAEQKQIIVPENIVPLGVNTNYPKFTININDKFRMINELFLGNSTEYNMGIEQLNSLNSANDATVYLKELKKIYNWKDDSEMVMKLTALVQKRFV